MVVGGLLGIQEVESTMSMGGPRGTDGVELLLLAESVSVAPVGWAVLSPDGRFLWVNEQVAMANGAPPAAHVGRRVDEVASADRAAHLLVHVEAVAATRAAMTGIRATFLHDGVPRPYVEAFVPVLGDTGEVRAITNLWWELPEPSDGQPDPELEARFRALANTTPALIWMSDRTGGCDWFNNGWLAFTGRTMADEVGDGWTAGVHPDDLERCLAVYRRAFDARQAFEMEYRLRRHDGTYRWVLDRGAPRFGHDASFDGFLGACTDIDDRKTAEAHKARLLAAERRARAQAEATADRLVRLQHITEAFAAALTTEQVFEVVVTEAVAASGADAGAVFIVDHDQRTIRTGPTVGYPVELVDHYPKIDVDDDTPVAHAVRTSRPVVVADLASPPPEFESFVRRLPPQGNRALAALPLVVDGRVMGAVGLSYRQPQAFGDDERRFLGATAQQCAAALDRAQLLQRFRHGQERLQFLADASAALSSTLDRGEVLDRVCRLAVPRLADWAAAHVADGTQLHRVSVAHPDPVHEARIRELAGDAGTEVTDPSPVAVCYRTGQVQHHPTLDAAALATLSPEARRAVEEAGVTGGMLVPILARGQVLGVLTFALADPLRRHSPEDVSAAVELGRRVGSALDNASVYEREHRMAEALQRSVLPGELPHVPGLELTARYLPAGSGVRVGGDWYDAFRLRDGRLGLTVGDVAGHGLQAASTMGQVRNALRAYAIDGSPPSEVLTRLNRLLLDDPVTHHLTALYATFDPDTGELTWSRAGHPPAVLLGERSEVLASPPGTMLGAVDVEYRDGCATIAAGGSLVLYTDGLVERRGEHLDQGLARLVAGAAAHATSSSEQLSDDLVNASLAGHPRQDDVCVLVLRRL